MNAAIELGTGIAVSSFATSAALSETGEVGWSVASSTKQALSVVAVEKLQLAIDHTTPELGMLGAGLRRVGRRDIGSLRTVDFERLHLGLGFATHGMDLDAGLGIGFAFGVISFRGVGFDVSVDTYLLDPSNPGGPDKLFMVTLGFVYSPIPGVHAGPPVVASAPLDHHEPTRPPCRDLAAYQDALVRERKIAVENCNKGSSPACDTSKAVITALTTRAKACYEGEDVGPPTEIDDAPVP